ncbi:MAG: type II secretion system protein [Fibrobacteraceae bacterium]|nr:type II secretion system protein [Fibrobacteraceae bacterium]
MGTYRQKRTSGFTLIEVLVVVSILGILSSIGVVSFVNAVANARVSDAARSTTAFLQSVAAESKRMNDTLCVKVNSRELIVRRDNCESGANYKTFTIDAPNEFVSGNCSGTKTNWKTSNGDFLFIPKIGLSAAPSEGCLRIKYRNDLYGAAVKALGNNTIKAYISHDGTTWSEL